VEINGLAAIRCWPIDVDIAGRQHRIPPRPAAEWIVAITSSWSDVVPGLIDPSDLDLTDRISRGDIVAADLTVAAKDAVAAAAGMPWWAAVRLIGAGTSQTSVVGELALAAVDATSISLAAWCSAVYQTMARNSDDKQRARLDRDITATPEGMTVEERYDEQAAADAFEARFAARGGT
jgi:hypothetical protein